jgi:phenylalanyl-tRNA synthetase beta chain
MVVVEFLSSEMEKRTGLSKDKIIDGLTEIGAPCEYLDETKKILAELTPNRPDWYSMEGLARSLVSYYRKENNQYSAQDGNFKVIVDKSVSRVRPHSLCAVVQGLKLDDEKITDIVLLQEKLLATLGRRAKKFGIGFYPLDAIKFPVRYTLMEPGKIKYRPLNYPHEANANEILEKHPKGIEHGHVLDGLKRYPVFLDGNENIMALIPIVNSQDTGKVNVGTKDVFIEVTGTDVNAVRSALNIIVCSLSDMGGKIISVDMEYPDDNFKSPDLEMRRIKLELNRVGQILGIDLKKKKAGELLSMMGYTLEGDEVLVPPYRADILGEIDIIEDIAIAYGYNEFEPSIPNFFTPGDPVKRYDRIDNIMRGMGFSQIDSFILTNEEKIRECGYDGPIKTILNPSGDEFTAIRPTLIPDMLDTFTTNKTKGIPQKYYEIGVIFDGTSRRKLSFGIMSSGLEFSEVKGYLQTLMRELGIDFSLSAEKMKIFDSEKGARIIVDGKEKGVFGKLDPKYLLEKGVKFDIYLCELEIE